MEYNIAHNSERKAVIIFIIAKIVKPPYCVILYQLSYPDDGNVENPSEY